MGTHWDEALGVLLNPQEARLPNYGEPQSTFR